MDYCSCCGTLAKASLTFFSHLTSGHSFAASFIFLFVPQGFASWRASKRLCLARGGSVWCCMAEQRKELLFLEQVLRLWMGKIKWQEHLPALHLSSEVCQEPSATGGICHASGRCGRLGSRFLLLSLKRDYLGELGDITVEADSYSEASPSEQQCDETAYVPLMCMCYKAAFKYFAFEFSVLQKLQIIWTQSNHSLVLGILEPAMLSELSAPIA